MTSQKPDQQTPTCHVCRNRLSPSLEAFPTMGPRSKLAPAWWCGHCHQTRDRIDPETHPGAFSAAK